MNFVALKMITGDKAKYLGLIFTIAFCPFLLQNQTFIFAGILKRAGSQIADVTDAEIWVMDRQTEYWPDTLISAAVAMINEAQGAMRIEDLTLRVGLSQSALERRFRKVVGASPKQFASTVRLHRVLDLGEDGTDFTSIAHAAGYYDQSHFIKDFKRFTGLPPTKFEKQINDFGASYYRE